MAKATHTGKLLEKAIKKKGLKKIHLVRKLKTTKPTFGKRLIDGLFTEEQLKTIKNEGWLD